MYNKSGGHLHLLYWHCVYKSDSSVYLDGHYCFLGMKQVFQLTWKSQQLHKSISMIKAHKMT